jgi:hypothetical protein
MNSSSSARFKDEDCEVKHLTEDDLIDNELRKGQPKPPQPKYTGEIPFAPPEKRGFARF